MFGRMMFYKVERRQLGIRVFVAGLAAAAVVLAGCNSSPRPHLRLGCCPTSTPGTRFLEPGKLGRHSYGYDWRENNGIVYTCRGGHIDIAHVRTTADQTRYLAEKSYAHLMRGDAQFCFKLRVEPSKYFVTIRYPERWGALSKAEKARAALPVALKLGQYLAYMSSTWHEILVWFGYKSARVVPQFPSAFSWEDNYSNVLGAHLGVRALEQTEKSYDEAMTELLDRELEKLGVQSRATTIAASKKMRGKWYTGNLLIQMKKRHLDIGLDDGYVSPMLVPGVCDGAKPQRYPVSNLILPRASRFGLSVEIEPKEWEGGAILGVVYPDGEGRRLKPEVHFGAIMDHIAEEATEKYGYDINVEGSGGAAELFGDYR